MIRPLPRVICYPALGLIFGAALIAAHTSPADEPAWPDFMDITSLDAMRAPLDTVVLYGGPGTAEGKFQVLPNGGPPDPQGWTSVDLTEVTLPVPDRAGDFAKLMPLLVDIDPCYTNLTPQWTFIDDGTPVNNAPLSTGGSIGTTWTYGPGGYVVNYTNGVSTTGLPIHNEIRSPVIDWNPVPGSDAGIAWLEFDLWAHMPLENGIFWTWGYRQYTGGSWSDWYPPRAVGANPAGWLITSPREYWDDPEARRVRILLATQNPDSIQVSLGVIDVADALGLTPFEATPAPWFDNVSVVKINTGGPVLSTRDEQLFQDAFPADGTLTGAVRFDVAADSAKTGWAPAIAGMFRTTKDWGDSATANFTSGSNNCPPFRQLHAQAARVTLVAVMQIDCNPDHPGWPAPCEDGLVVDPKYNLQVLGPNLVRFTVDAETSSVDGSWITFGVDLPDPPESAVFYPGSAVHFYFECEDCLGIVRTVPADLSGFGDFSETSLWKRQFTVRALPTPEGRTPGAPPRILVWVDGSARSRIGLDASPSPGSEGSSPNLWRRALGELGLVEGLDYDMYVTRTPEGYLGNGLGSAGEYGATASQLAGYNTIIYSGDRRRLGLLSDGSDILPHTSSDDLSLLSAWHALPGERFHIYFGDSFLEGMAGTGPASAAFLTDILGVEFVAADVRTSIGGQGSPVVAPPAVVGWNQEYAAVGSACPRRDFDRIQPVGVGPVIHHRFLDGSGVPIPGIAASVLWDRLETGDRKVTMVFPYSLASILESREASTITRSTRAALLEEVLAYLGHTGGGPPVDTEPPSSRALHVKAASPNPFNPGTTIEYEAPREGVLSVRIYDLRGRRVDTIFDGPVTAGRGSVRWRGIDASGQPVASGVYVVEVRGFGDVHRQKLALLR